MSWFIHTSAGKYRHLRYHQLNHSEFGVINAPTERYLGVPALQKIKMCALGSSIQHPLVIIMKHHSMIPPQIEISITKQSLFITLHHKNHHHVPLVFLLMFPFSHGFPMVFWCAHLSRSPFFYHHRSRHGTRSSCCLRPRRRLWGQARLKTWEIWLKNPSETIRHKKGR